MEKIFCSSLSWCERSHYVRRLVSKSVMVYRRTRECGKVKLAMRASARSRCQSIYLHPQFIFSSFLVRIVEKEEEKN